MRNKIIEHSFSIILVSIILISAIWYIENRRSRSSEARSEQLKPYLEQEFIDLKDPFNKALLEEVLHIYTEMNPASIDSLLRELEAYRTDSIFLNKSIGKRDVDFVSLRELSGMYLKFIFAFVITILFTYYAVQTLAVIRFIRFKQNRESYLAELYRYLNNIRKNQQWKYYLDVSGRASTLLVKAILKGLFSLLLFAPAYVIAYSFRTRFDTDSLLFMVLLGVISNGLLITYAQKFFTFLVSESRKGYVQTAVVKNLNASYEINQKGGILLKWIFRIRKRFPNHVFDHIYSNACHQYLSTIKEQASFLITGLIIIEMALNIQGHLCYELLQNLLYKNYGLVLVILMGIFYLVKFTEVGVDWIIHRDTVKYENRS